MVKIEYCDRCNKVLRKKEREDMSLFDDHFDSFGDSFGDAKEILLNGKKTKVMKRVRKAQLCNACLEGYNQIIDNANEEVKKHLANIID